MTVFRRDNVEYKFLRINTINVNKINDNHYILDNLYNTKTTTIYTFNNLRIELPNSLNKNINNIIPYDASININNGTITVNDITYNIAINNDKPFYMIPLVLADNLIINKNYIELEANDKILKVPKFLLDNQDYGGKILFEIVFSNCNKEKEYYNIKFAWRDKYDLYDTVSMIFKPSKKEFSLLDFDFLMKTSLMHNNYFFQALNYFVLSSI